MAWIIHNLESCMLEMLRQRTLCAIHAWYSYGTSPKLVAPVLYLNHDFTKDVYSERYFCAR